MPEDPRGNFTITSITNELDSFKFRVLQGVCVLVSAMLQLVPMFIFRYSTKSRIPRAD
jgi:hypothetical protein